MSSLLFVIVASLFAEEFVEMNGDSDSFYRECFVYPCPWDKPIPGLPRRIPIMLDGAEQAPEVYDENFLKTIGGIAKKLAPVVLPKIAPKIAPYVLPFLSEELEQAIMDELAEQFDMDEVDESFLKSVGAYLKPRLPNIIRTVVPLIPKWGPKIAPIIEPFLSEEMDMVEMDEELDEGFLKTLGGIAKKLAPVVLPKILPKVAPFILPFLTEELEQAVMEDMASTYDLDEVDEAFWPTVGKIAKVVVPIAIKVGANFIPYVGPVISAFLSEDADMDTVMPNPLLKPYIFPTVKLPPGIYV